MRGSLWPVKPMKRTLPFLARFERRFEAAFVEDPVGIVVVDHLVKLPEIEMIGLQAAQAVLQVLRFEPS